MKRFNPNQAAGVPGFGNNYGALFKRFWHVLTKPSQAIEETKYEDARFSMEYFGFFCTVYAVIITILVALIPKTNPTPLPSIVLYSLLFVALWLGTIIALYIYALLLHIIVFIAGGREGAKQTRKAVFYSLTPAIIPFIGLFFSVWFQVKAISSYHNISAKKAAACVIIFAVALVIAYVAVLSSVMTPSGIEGKVMTISVVDGPVQDATVNVYELLPDGTKGKLLLGPLKTDLFGNIDIPLDAELPYRLLIEAKGGTYTDDVSKMPVSLTENDVMTTILPAGIRRAAVTPFTHMAAELALERIRGGTPIDDAVTQSNIDIAQRYNLQSILEVVPVMASSVEAQKLAELEERKYSALLGGLAKEAADLKVRAIDLAAALAKDFSDGVLDGMQNGMQTTMKDMLGKEIALPADSGRERLQRGITDFLNSRDDATQLKELFISVNPRTGSPDFAITTTALPNWESGRQGAFTLTARGGAVPYIWALKAGSALPPGFALSRDGVLSGSYTLGQSTTKRITPPFTVTVIESSGKTREIELRITIVASPPVLNLAPAVCVVNQPCDRQTATATGGIPGYYYKSDTFRNGAPPFGMLVSIDGRITGTPKNLGNFQFGICVVDSVGGSVCGTATLMVVTQEQFDNELQQLGSTTPPHPEKDIIPAIPYEAEETETGCSSDSQCTNPVGNQCSIPANSRCGTEDKLCHCCLEMCYGNDCSCIPCSAGCSGGTYCEKDVCVFKQGWQLFGTSTVAEDISLVQEPEQPASEPEGWTGSISGTSPPWRGGCTGGQYSESYTLSLDFPDKLSKIVDKSSMISGKGTISGTETIASPSSDWNCRLVEHSVSNTHINLASFDADITPTGKGELAKITLFVEELFMPRYEQYCTTQYEACDKGWAEPEAFGYQSVQLMATSISETSISGYWGVREDMPHGTFSLNRQ